MVAWTMPELHVGRGASLGPLTVFPVWTGTPLASGLVTGRAARVAVAEREGSPVVGELVVSNHGSRPALLVEGELLEGGWQHRVLQHDVLLAVGGSLVASVACVEAGRWQGDTGHRRRVRRASPMVRAALTAVPPAARQQEVWRRVAGYDATLGASPTSSYVDHVDRLDAGAGGDGPARLLARARRARPLPGQRGLLVGVAGHPVLVEVYPSASALAAHLGELLAGMLLDATAAAGPSVVTPGRRARRLIERLDGLRAGPDRSVDAGAGAALATDTPHAVVRGLGVGDRWAHLTVLNRRHPLLEVA